MRMNIDLLSIQKRKQWDSYEHMWPILAAIAGCFI